MTCLHRAYGVNLASDTLVPGLPLRQLDSEPPDIVLSLGLEPDWVREGTSLPSHVHHPKPGRPVTDHATLTLTSFGDAQFFQLAYDDGSRFVVDSAAERLWGTCSPPLTIEDLTTYLAGPVLGFALRRRGILPLHASAARLGDHAVLLCGESEAGKSTMAASLALAGFPVLAEDISPIKEESGIFYVEPGYPRICLWPEAVQNLFGTPEALPLLTPNWEKRFLTLDGTRAKFEPQRRPLGVVYIFSPRQEEGRAPRIEDLGVRDALLGLVQNTYMNWLLDRGQRAEELDVLSRIVARVPVRRIVPHVDPARIGALRDLIVADAERLFAAQDSAAALRGR